MQPDKPSATAFNVALHRAAHQLLDNGRIFKDPLAVRILGPRGAVLLRQIDNRPATRRWRTFICARAQFAEGHLCAAIEDHRVSQLVVLGAGLDTFAYRNRYENTLNIFEVDHPATQQWKRKCLLEAGIHIPRNVKHVPLVIGQDKLISHLEAAGFDTNCPSFFICLGLFYYLSEKEVENILKLIAEHKGQVAFDYNDPPAMLSGFERDAIADMQNSLATAGEPYVSYFAAAELHATMRSMGYRTIEDLDPADWMQRFGGAKMLAAWRNITADPHFGTHLLSART